MLFLIIRWGGDLVKRKRSESAKIGLVQNSNHPLQPTMISE